MRRITKICLFISVLVVCFCCVYTVACIAMDHKKEDEPVVVPSTETIKETEPAPTEKEPVITIPEEPKETKEAEASAEELFWQQSHMQYPVATEVWLLMKEYGWSDAACAGILGNIMRETGGDTLYIQFDIYNSSRTHYGLCQWSKKYYPDIQPKNDWAPSVIEQMNYLRYTINHQRELRVYYAFEEDYLIHATDYREVAKKFCDGYERPAENSTRRENNAEKAWHYFVLRKEK